MNTGVSRTARHNAKRWIQEVDRLLQRPAFGQVTKMHDLPGRKAASDIVPEERGDRETDEPVGVPCGLDHRKGGAVDNQHRAVREDRSRNLDGFVIAISEVYSLHVGEPTQLEVDVIKVSSGAVSIIHTHHQNVRQLQEQSHA
jgi:hypothetical protein